MVVHDGLTFSISEASHINSSSQKQRSVLHSNAKALATGTLPARNASTRHRKQRKGHMKTSNESKAQERTEETVEQSENDK